MGGVEIFFKKLDATTGGGSLAFGDFFYFFSVNVMTHLTHRVMHRER